MLQSLMKRRHCRQVYTRHGGGGPGRTSSDRSNIFFSRDPSLAPIIESVQRKRHSQTSIDFCHCSNKWRSEVMWFTYGCGGICNNSDSPSRGRDRVGSGHPPEERGSGVCSYSIVSYTSQTRGNLESGSKKLHAQVTASWFGKDGSGDERSGESSVSKSRTTGDMDRT